MLTPEVIIETARRLPLSSRREIVTALQRDLEQSAQPTISEDETERILFERGVTGSVTDFAVYTDADDDFELLEIEGQPLSERVIANRAPDQNDLSPQELTGYYRFQQSLYEQGLISEIKPPRRAARHHDFPLLKVEGRPVSETIIEERR